MTKKKTSVKKSETETRLAARSPYSPRLKVALICDPKSARTKQNHKRECDINFIMSQFERTGQISHLNHNKPNYGFAPATDFKSALDTVIQAEESFMDLPADIRERFNHDPAQFLEFVEDDQNGLELAQMGLLDKESTQAHYEAYIASQEASEASNSDGSEGQQSDPTS